MYGQGPPPAGRPTGGTAGTDGFAGAAELDGDAADVGGGAADWEHPANTTAAAGSKNTSRRIADPLNQAAVIRLQEPDDLKFTKCRINHTKLL
jgi:hypothetical protein